MNVSKDELGELQSLRGTAGWTLLTKILAREQETLTDKLVSGPADIAVVAKLQGAISNLKEIQLLVKP